jgi:glycosyltransferase involved in cell wall biosynthesis
VSRLNVMVVHNRYRSAAPSGEDKVVDTEIAALRQAGHAVQRFERRSDEIAAWSPWQRAALPLTVVHNPWARKALLESLREERPDVVHVHNTFPLLSPSVLRACAEAQVPVVVTIHNYKLACARGEFFRQGSVCHDCSGQTGLAAIAYRCYRDSAFATVPVVLGTRVNRSAWQGFPSAYIFISHWQRQALGGLEIPAHRSFVKWNLVPRPSVSEVEGDDRVVYAGRLDEAKGLHVLMKGWDLLQAGNRAARRTIRLAIAGGGPLEPEVRAWAAAREDVEVLGLLPREECLKLVAGARAAVVPSAWEETFGLVAVEAMAAGVPVIAAGHGSLAELVRDGTEGALFRPGDPSDLARVLLNVATEPGRWRKLRESARRSYSERFDPEANLEQLLEIYRFAVEHPAPSGPSGRRKL